MLGGLELDGGMYECMTCVLSGKCSNIRTCRVSLIFCVCSELFGHLSNPIQFLFCWWCIILLSFDMVDVLLVFVVNSLRELALACLTAYLFSLLMRLYSAQFRPPFVLARW